MVDRVAGGKALPAEVLEQIVAKTDGVPLFVEELTKTVLESGLLREENGAYVLATALTPLAIPSTLQDSLMARLDRLAPVKEIAQIGAAIGREFSYRLLEAVSPIQGPALQDALGQLMAAELIHARGAPPEATYVFKHALVQDTAYASLLRSRRQRIHADIARALEERFADQIEAAPAIIAHHYTEAGLAEPAARYWLKAAELALSRSAYAEADRYVDAGLALIPCLTDGPDRQSLELALQLARANALLPLKGFTAPETVAALTEAKRLLDAGVGTDLQRFSCFMAFGRPATWRHRWSRRSPWRAKLWKSPTGRTTRSTGSSATASSARCSSDAGRTAKRWRVCNGRAIPRSRRQKLLSYRFGADPGLAVLCYKYGRCCSLASSTRRSESASRCGPNSSHGHAP